MRIQILQETYSRLIRESLSNSLADYVASELGFNMNADDSFIGKGDFGSVYDIGNNKVLKITYEYPTTPLQLKGKKIDGLVDIYDSGAIDIPESYRDFYNKSSEVYYIVMEKVKISKSLESNLRLFNKIFVDMKNQIDMWSAVAEKYDSYNSLDFLARMAYFKKDSLAQKFINSLDKKYYDIAKSLYKIFINLKANNIIWIDIHEGQFGYDSSNNIVALDVEDEREDL